MRAEDGALLQPYVDSVALELLQRAALHRHQHGLTPHKLEVGLNMLCPSLATCGAECTECSGGSGQCRCVSGCEER